MIEKWISTTAILLISLGLSISSPMASPIDANFHTNASSGEATPMNTTELGLVTVSIIGSSGADRVVAFQGSHDGSNFQSIACRNMSTQAVATSVAASSTTLIQFQCPVGGLRKFRTTVSGGATGTVTVKGTGIAGITAYLPPISLTDNLTISNSAPSLTFDDTTGGATDYHILVDANLMEIKRVAGASGEGICFSGANIGFRTCSPGRELDFAITASGRFSRATATQAGLLEFFNSDTTDNNGLSITWRGNDLGGTGRNAVSIKGIYTTHGAAAISGKLALGTTSAGTATTDKFFLDPLGNFGSNDGWGTGAQKTFSLALGVCPSTAIVDGVQLCSADISGAGTAGLKIIDEGNNNFSIGNGQVLVPDGTATVPSLAYATQTQVGFRLASSVGLYWTATGADKGFLGSNGTRLPSTGLYTWSANTGPGNAADSGFARNAAGVIEVNNGTAGTFRDLKLRKQQWTTDAEPTCDSTTRFTVVAVAGGAGVADTFRVCSKDAGDAYAYRALF